MAGNIIIAIGREFGSGGHEVGQRLAKKLNIPFYDKNLVHMAAKKLDISDITAATLDEKALDYFLSTYEAPEQVELRVAEESNLPLSEQMYLVQSEIIKSLVLRGSCVVVGRCSDYILRDNKHCISAFICGNEVDKSARIAEQYQTSLNKAREKIKKVDAERKYYYETHTGRTWGSIRTHQLLFNSSLMKIDDIVAILAAYYTIVSERGE